MTRRSFRKPAITLSLFPFLAVLVCTMGALIVLLVSVLQKARTDAITVAEAQSSQQAVADKERLEKLRIEKEDQEWRRSELERQRTEFQKKLTQQRMTLSHFEDHIRQLEEQLKQLSAQAEGLTQIRSQQTSGLENEQQKLELLKAEITKKREELKKIQQQISGKKRAFAVVPYDGPNGTKRRPIYIECTDQGIVLQPEGIVLSPSDFVGSLGPGNPLDAALRTTREYLAKYDSVNGQSEPYPLLIVRPNGTVAYAAARAALKSWDDEFGYELVEADLKLAYPNPDPTLAQELQRTVADARQRQEVLAAVMPGRFKQTGTTGLVATPNGGFTTIGGSALPTRKSTAGGNSGGDGELAGAASSFTRSFRGASLGPENRVTSMEAAQKHRAAPQGNQAGGSLSANGHPGRFPDGSTGPSSSPSGNPNSANSETLSPNSNGSNSDSAPAGSTSPFGMVGLPVASKEFKAGDATNSNSASTAQSDPNGQNRGPARKPPIGMEPLANSRGSDWGLPNRGSTITGIQRYVQIDCQPDRLVLLQDRIDYRNPTVIPMAGETAAAVDPLIAALWKRMEQWGIAADGCYWKPVLRVHVHPEAEQRFAELATLLDSSGIVLERKEK